MMLIPNILGLPMMYQRMTSPALRAHVGRQTYPDPVNPFSTFPAAQEVNADAPNFNGFVWPQALDRDDQLRYFFHTPGMEFNFECSKETNERFTRYGSQL